MMTQPDANPDSDLQHELRLARKFSLAEVIGREGSDFMKGESPIPPLMQAITQINLFIDQHLDDSIGALQAVLQAWVKAQDAQVSRYMDRPLAALQKILQDILSTPETLYEVVRQADVRWGQIFGERPHFQQPGQAAHPDDKYTHESVRVTLKVLLEAVESDLRREAEEREQGEQKQRNKGVEGQKSEGAGKQRGNRVRFWFQRG
ncbi:hypothetical protein [Pseudanabaena sp. FACHB-2040]|uniref:hypothetical protein n=1 Tax=Pseudanabaena sp. FACHB-2040 TaxID=2692859 RepID=UPI0018F0027C|nr:hypothetical protein [Pseudanabaena sp. FACHB-2040]